MAAGGPTKEVIINLLKATVTGVTWTAYTTPPQLALCSDVGDYDTAGTEISGGSYARQDLGSSAFGTPSDKSVSSNAAVSFTAMPAVTVSSVEIYDNDGTSPIRLWFGDIVDKTTNAGDTLTFATGQITVGINSST